MRNLNEIHENAVLSRWADLLRRHPDQIGDLHETDAELLPLDEERVLAVTVDTVAEEVATGLYREARTVGRIAVLSSVSDLSAVGASPLGLLVSCSIPLDGFEETQRAVGEGLRAASDTAGTFILGGDTNQGPNLEVTVTAVGLVPRERVVTRVGMRPGDRLFVSGPIGLGGAWAAASLLGLEGMVETDYAPAPRLTEGAVVRQFASACMDTSDGFLATVDQLARLNEVRCDIGGSLENLLHPIASDMSTRTGIGAFPFAASYHGEFELVFAVPPDDVEPFLEAAEEIGWKPLPAGAVAAGEGVSVGGRAFDGAALRNLLDDVGGDIGEYARQLIAWGHDGE